MSALREAAQQALEALEEYAPQHGRPDDMMSAITALRAALAQPQPIEQCAWPAWAEACAVAGAAAAMAGQDYMGIAAAIRARTP